MQRGRRLAAAFGVVTALSVAALSACSAENRAVGVDVPVASNAAAAVVSSPTTVAVGSDSVTAATPATPTTAVTATPALPALPALPATAYVDVSVATLWRSPSSPRVVDAAATRRPVGVRSWLSSMTLSQRRALNGRVDSQLLLGERVIVDRRQGSWAHVVVPDQPTPLDTRGYPGWIPLAQLSFRAAPGAGQEAVVTAPTAWLYVGTTRLAEVSMATRLPVLSSDAGWVHSETPDGRAVSLRSADVIVVRRGGAARAASGADVVRTAQLFVGLPYLWGGTSGFGFDCSGLTHLVYAMRGVTIPRDADAQAHAGVPVARADLLPGDLVFFASNGFVHHVGIYAGNNLMLHAPQTGSTVQVLSLSTQPYANEYSGARRYVH